MDTQVVIVDCGTLKKKGVGRNLFSVAFSEPI
jgi:hypothetical protein